ncbi:uncharacterized protein LOC116118114 [Pistacia vera]|uniref:uncharacterized protein LOC116118114 n=1 Tax=Pistacia vera TaxID=55513 RepID=UPI0012636F80|nr:uncharacterized protein LOC116118114 [Pistacia vera]
MAENQQSGQHYIKEQIGKKLKIRKIYITVRLYDIEDARQYALAAKKRVSCYGARKPGHTSFACPQRRVNLAEFEEELELEPVFYEYDEEIEEIDVHVAQGESLVVRKVMTTTIKAEEEDWRRHNIFRTCVVCGGNVCDLVIDGGSIENIISKEVVDKLNLPIITHPHPYKVGWLKKGHKILITSQCLVKFIMGGNLEDEALCDIVPMDVVHILVGRPWLFDHEMDHKTKPNTYSFYKDNKRYTLHPLKEKAKQLATKSSTTSKTTRYLSVKKFNAEHALLAPKKDGSWRMCMDSRAINKITIKYHFPIPQLEDMLDQLADSKVFSKIDLKNGYHQIRMRCGDEWKTAFKTPDGLFEWLVMPFGLSNVSSTFMRVMTELPTVRSSSSWVHCVGKMLKTRSEKDFEKFFVVECDASHVGIGAVLSQDGKPLEFFSKKLSDSRRCYSTYDLEFYALSNVVVDALSRRSLLLSIMSTQVTSFEELKNQYGSDLYFCKIIAYLQRSSQAEKLSYRLHDDYLFKGNELCIPEGSLREQIIRELHGNGLGGHFSRDKTFVVVADRYYWQKM